VSAHGVTPVFVFSQPRAGSTLLQRILAAHPQVATEAEPWLMLPPLFALRRNGVLADYGHAILSRATAEFAASLPDGLSQYYRRTAQWATSLYADASPPGATHFLDKTPRYYHIADELPDVFEHARFLFLWRNPLATAASMFELWGGKRWSEYAIHNDLYLAIHRLCTAFERHRDDPRVHAVRYEDLLTNPESTVRTIAAHVGVDDSDERIDDMIRSFGGVRLKGSMGDPTGRKAYQQLSREPLEKWKHSVTNAYRKRWMRRYLKWLSPGRLEVMGYDHDALSREVQGIRPAGGNLWRDLRSKPKERIRLKLRKRLLYETTPPPRQNPPSADTVAASAQAPATR
jgi:hypothetical protein